jgi:hypothetical protein
MQGISRRFLLIMVLLCFGLGVICYAIPQRINYQGVLKNKATGQILPDGSYGVTFRLYTASTGGSAVWTESATVTISNGILNYQLGSAVALALSFDASYYLGVQVSGDSEMSPRERLTSVGYAYRAADADNATNAVNATNTDMIDGLDSNDFLRTTGGTFTGTLSGGIFYGNDNSSGPIISGMNLGVGPGIYGYSTATAAIVAENGGAGSAIYARNSSSTLPTLSVHNYCDMYSGSGNAIYAESSSALPTLDVRNYNYSEDRSGVGMHIFSRSGDGILASAYGSSSNGIESYVDGPEGWAFYGISDKSYAGYFMTYNPTNYAVYADGGLYSKARSTPAIYGYSTNDNPAIVAINDGTTGNGYGLYVSSSTYRGAYIKAPANAYALYVDSGSSSGMGARINGNLYVSGDVTVGGSKAGYVIDYCKNSATGTLEAGDVVIIQGSEPAVIGRIPVMLVSKTSTAYNTAVVGVVDKSLSITASTRLKEPDFAPLPEEPKLSGKVKNVQSETIASVLPSAPTAMVSELEIRGDFTAVVQPNDLVSVVTLGAFEAVKVDASFGAIHPGDLLTTSATAGYAMKAQPVIIEGKPFYPNGCIIGKALGSLESGQGTIPVSVNRQ